MSLALQLFQTGKNTFNENSAFLLYWMAIVQLLGISNTKDINKKLQVLYSMSKKEVEDGLKWKWAYETRNALMHKAKSVVLNADIDIERYFQLLFLDLLRGELKLECKEFLKNYLISLSKNTWQNKKIIDNCIRLVYFNTVILQIIFYWLFLV